MKLKLLTAISIFTIALSGVAGVSSSVCAANVTDTNYSFYNINADGYTDPRSKENTTKVYVHPTSGPTLNYTVQGSTAPNGSWNNRSNTHSIPAGTYASITNYVRESGETWARLHLQRTTTAYEWTYGVWSPDATQNYTIYN